MKTLEQLRDEKFRDPETAAQISSSSHYFAFCEGFAYRDELANDQLEKMTKALQVAREALKAINKEELDNQRPGGGYSKSASLSYETLTEINKILKGLK